MNKACDETTKLSRQRLLSLLPLLGAGIACTGPGGDKPGVPSATGAWPTSAPRASVGALVANPAKDEWPERFWKASAEVQEAYRYALANPDVIQYFPCFCGCVNDGHASNKDCYIKEARADGSFVLEPMSFG